MIALEELQRQFQSFVLGGDFAILRSVVESPHGDSGPRLAIYHDAYRIRLCEALGDTFGTLREHLGPTDFDALCARYVACEPSTVRNVRWYGAGLADFLESARPYDERPWLAELARLDWALVGAFDAADLPPVTLEAMTRLSAEAWPVLAFEFHPSVARLTLSTNAPSMRRATDNGEVLPEARRLDAAVEWLVWRQDARTNYRSLQSPEAAALDGALAGTPFAALCAQAGEQLGAAEASMHAAQWLRRWIEEGLIVRLVI